MTDMVSLITSIEKYFCIINSESKVYICTKEQTFVPCFILYISLPSASNLSLKYHGNKQICLIKLSWQGRRGKKKKQKNQRIFKSWSRKE